MATTLVGAAAAMTGWFAVARFQSLGAISRMPAEAAPVTVQPEVVGKPLNPAYRTLEWDDLIPAGWDPSKSLNPADVNRLKDGTGRANALMSQMRSIWDEAPTVTELDGASVKIPGYVVPLAEEHGRWKEFLLVPYFGACIHTPPPPANQIIHVVTRVPLRGFKAMDTVWVSGAIRQARDESFMGTSGYELAAEVVERYAAPPVGNQEN